MFRSFHASPNARAAGFACSQVQRSTAAPREAIAVISFRVARWSGRWPVRASACWRLPAFREVRDLSVAEGSVRPLRVGTAFEPALLPASRRRVPCRNAPSEASMKDVLDKRWGDPARGDVHNQIADAESFEHSDRSGELERRHRLGPRHAAGVPKVVAGRDVWQHFGLGHGRTDAAPAIQQSPAIHREA